MLFNIATYVHMHMYTDVYSVCMHDVYVYMWACMHVWLLLAISYMLLQLNQI